MGAAADANVVRRRGTALEDAIFAAAESELTERGFTKTTVKGIAERAGTGKAVLYRRWPNLSELVLDLLRRRSLDLEVPDTGSVRDDLREFLMQACGLLADLPPDAIPGLVASTVQNPELARQISERIGSHRFEDVFRAIFERGAERGEVRPGPYSDRILTLPMKLLRHDLVMGKGVPSHSDIDEVVDVIVMPLMRTAG
ncbi:TetR/AcrR family transcriptional regulator [Glycomyces tenuis]|uniref:TetR/AcrR family transcriptional regulator n=1 Tax=Glycomyces tenuis TaxID=58116 RepID=UPI00047D267D|nr:TetR/AcrR family transcriptional regulator [Glycomyces tenuis]